MFEIGKGITGLHFFWGDMPFKLALHINKKKLNLGAIMFHELKVEYIPINHGVPWFGPIIGKQ